MKRHNTPLIPPYDATYEYHEGIKAFNEGKKILENPYRYNDIDRPKYLQWQKGYQHAKKVYDLMRKQ